MATSLLFRVHPAKFSLNSFAKIFAQNNWLATHSRNFAKAARVPPPVDIPDPGRSEFADFVEDATGSEKKQLLALLQGDDRYEPKLYHRGPGTKDQPNIVPLYGESRMIGCVCEPDQCYINYMTINMDEFKRCECGYWFKSVEADPESHQ